MSAVPPGAAAGGDDWLDELRRDYAQALPGKYASLERRLADLARAPDDGAALGALLADVHRLHGTAGSYGFAELSRLAGEWEVQLLELRAGGRAVSAGSLARMEARLCELRGLDEHGATARPLPPREAGGSAG